jgi:hypothetical protein
VLHDDRAKRPALAGKNIVEGKLNSASHERIVHELVIGPVRISQRYAEFMRKSVDMDLPAAVIAEQRV